MNQKGLHRKPRFSDGLDFTFTQHIKTEDLEKQLIKAMEGAKTKSGIRF